MTAPQHIDLIINARWIIPVVPARQTLEHCALAVNKGTILAILPQAEAAKKYTAKETVSLDSHVICPGLVNSHGHIAMTLLRGYADDLALKPWLEQYIWPAEGKWVSEQFVKDGAELAMAEMLLSGTTCFSDMYFFPETVARAAQTAGMRCQVNFPILDFPTAWGAGPDEYLHKGLQLHDDFRASDLISIGFGPHAPYTVSNKVFEQVAIYAEELQAPIQVHLHETAHEVEEALNNTGERPLARLNHLGVIGPSTQCVHMTQVNDDDTTLLKTTGAHVIHCPESNLKLASGFCPVGQLMQAGVNVAIGTDGAASNNNLDLFGELRTAALLAKAVTQDPTTMDAYTALEMATLNGAKALGLDNEIGSLETGKRADVIAIDLSQLHTTPVYHPVSHLAYTGIGHNVTHSWVNGRNLVGNRELKTLSRQEILTKARQWQQSIQQR